MNTLQQILDSLGTPPDDLCLDWAWQLYEASSPNESDSEARESRRLTWRDIGVSQDGRLELPAELGFAAVADLIALLVQWQYRGGAVPSDWNRQSAARLLSTLTTDSTTRSKSTEPVGEFSESRKLAKHSSAVSADPSTAVSPRKRREATAFKGRSKVMLAAVAAIGALLLGLYWIFPRGDLDSNQVATGTAPQEQEGLRLPEGLVEVSDVEDFPDLTAELDEQEAAEFGPVFDELNLDLPLEDSAELSESGGSELVSPREANPDSMNDEPENGTQPNDGLAAVAGEAAKDAEELDVMAELADIAKQGELQVMETELESDDTQPLDPFSLLTVPMMQVQKLSPEFRLRARDPAWRLRIATSEGFVVKPPGPQSISKREVARWVIELEDPSEAGTQVFVMAQLVGSRGRSIRWRVGVGTPKLPQLVLPLGQQYLDRLQVNLAEFQTRLQLAVDQLKSLSTQTGIPRDMKSVMSARRRGFESQLEIATRVLEVVSEANQFEGWLDGQLEIHAEYVDLAAEVSTPLLQFGTLEPSKQKNNVDDDADNKAGVDEAPAADPS